MAALADERLIVRLRFFLIYRYLGCSAGQSTNSHSTQAKQITYSTITDGPIQIPCDHPQSGHLQTDYLQTGHHQTVYCCSSCHFDPNRYSLREIKCKNIELYYQTACLSPSLQERTNGIQSVNGVPKEEVSGQG